MAEKRKVKLGRPPLDKTVRRYKAVWVRLREGEYDEVKEKAAEQNVSVASYIREHVLGKEKK